MSALTCSQCQGPLALADAICPSCRSAVPAEARRALMLERGQALAQDERWAEAARSLAALPLEGLAVPEAKRLLRLRALWLQKQGSPSALAESEGLLRQVVGLDQADDLSHHAWMDLLKRLGRLGEAKAHYQDRLAQDPEDGVAMHQLSVLRLAEDMLLQPQPKLAFDAGGKPSLLQRMIYPTTGKMFTAGSVLLMSLGGMIWGFFSDPAAPAAAATAANSGLSDTAAMALAASSSGPASWVGGGGGQMASLLTDPWLNGIQAVLAAAYLYWGWKERRG